MFQETLPPQNPVWHQSGVCSLTSVATPNAEPGRGTNPPSEAERRLLSPSLPSHALERLRPAVLGVSRGLDRLKGHIFQNLAILPFGRARRLAAMLRGLRPTRSSWFVFKFAQLSKAKLVRGTQWACQLPPKLLP